MVMEDVMLEKVLNKIQKKMLVLKFWLLNLIRSLLKLREVVILRFNKTNKKAKWTIHHLKQLNKWVTKV